MNKRLSISVSSFILLAAAGGVLASTTTNTPGASCVAASGALINSVDGASANLGAVAATVWVVDESASGNVCCTINSKNPSGALVTNTAPVCSTGA